jgi:hypothetical protein
VHLAVKLPGEPVREACFSLSQIDVADAGLLKTEFCSPLLYTGREVLEIGLSVTTD